MNNTVSGVIQEVVQQTARGLSTPQQPQPQQPGAKNFEQVLLDGSTRPRTTENKQPEKVEGVSTETVDQLRKELSRRLSQIPGDAKSFDEVWPELFRTKNRMSLLREAMKGVDNTPTGTNLKGMFGKVEGEWYNLEKFMRSDKDLSTGELLGLQARLYQVSQHIDVMSKVVDQMTSGIKTILNTNV